MTIQADTADLLRAELMADEGRVLRVYDDANAHIITKGTVVLGYPTIGVGRNLAANGISDAECDFLLANDQGAAWRELSTALPWFTKLSPRRATALMSLYFNVALHSPAGFLARWPKLLAQLKAGQWDAAADNIEHAQPYASQVGPRAQRLGEMFRYG